MKTGDKATELHESGCNCAQSVLGACRDKCGLDMDTALGVGSGFGGGMGCGEICGAVSGGVMAIGSAFANAGPDKHENTMKVKKLSRDFIDGVRNDFGAVTCRELKSPGQAVPCARIIEYCAEKAGKIIDNNK